MLIILHGLIIVKLFECKYIVIIKTGERKIASCRRRCGKNLSLVLIAFKCHITEMIFTPGIITGLYLHDL